MEKVWFFNYYYFFRFSGFCNGNLFIDCLFIFTCIFEFLLEELLFILFNVFIHFFSFFFSFLLFHSFLFVFRSFSIRFLLFFYLSVAYFSFLTHFFFLFFPFFPQMFKSHIEKSPENKHDDKSKIRKILKNEFIKYDINNDNQISVNEFKRALKYIKVSSYFFSVLFRLLFAVLLDGFIFVFFIFENIPPLSCFPLLPLLSSSSLPPSFHSLLPHYFFR